MTAASQAVLAPKIMGMAQGPGGRKFLLMLGIAIKLAVLWQGGKLFESQIRSFLGYIEQYQWRVVAGLFVISMLQSVRRGRPKPGLAKPQ